MTGSRIVKDMISKAIPGRIYLLFYVNASSMPLLPSEINSYMSTADQLGLDTSWAQSKDIRYHRRNGILCIFTTPLLSGNEDRRSMLYRCQIQTFMCLANGTQTTLPSDWHMVLDTRSWYLECNGPKQPQALVASMVLVSGKISHSVSKEIKQV